MRTTRIIASLIVGSGLAQHRAQAQKSELGRTELTHRDLGNSAREVIETRVDVGPGAPIPKHSHPGVEVAYARGTTRKAGAHRFSQGICPLIASSGGL